MALHRDIFWVGRQWAVTGYGMQAVDQKQKGKFDIEASRLWEGGLTERMRAEAWLNIEDFDKALVVARKQFPQPPGAAAPLRESVSQVKENPVEAPRPPRAAAPLLETVSQLKENPIEAPKPAPQKFDMRIESWPAKFVQPWRIRISR